MILTYESSQFRDSDQNPAPDSSNRQLLICDQVIQCTLADGEPLGGFMAAHQKLAVWDRVGGSDWFSCFATLLSH